MKIVKVCIGSSCHVKGSHRVVAKFSEYIKSKMADAEVVLTSSFCMGQCRNPGVAVSITDENGAETLYSVLPDDADNFIADHII